MKKQFAILLAGCLLLTTVLWAVAAGGDADDPIASLSYLNGTFAAAVNKQVDQRLDKSDQSLVNGAGQSTAPVATPTAWAEMRLKSGDAFTGGTGTNMLLLAGGAKVSYSSGAVVDVSAGKVVSSGSALAVDHRYMVAEDTKAAFTVTSKTAVLDYQGSYSLQTSNAIDYNAIAAALKKMNLFKGSFTGFGQGFDLEMAPTRLQALIMFIRVLGEEEQALAWTGTTPFKDITKGSQAEKYVGYAYQKGYTNGYSATQFKPSGAVNAYQYTEFVLRAMRYSSASNTNISDALNRGQACGLLTSGEAAMLQKDKFLRAELVYVSYYALQCTMPNGYQTLGDSLMNKGVFDWGDWSDAQELVTGKRL